MSDEAENLSRARTIARIVARADCGSKGGKTDDHYCSILLSELDTKDARIAELEEALKYFIDRVEAGTIRSRTTYTMYKELLARGGE